MENTLEAAYQAYEKWGLRNSYMPINSFCCSWRETNYTNNAGAGHVAAIIMGLFVAETSSDNATDMLVYLMRHNMKDHKVKLSFSQLGIPFLFNSYLLTYVIVLKLS